MFTYKNNFLMNPFDMTGQGAPTSDGINTPLMGMIPMREVNIFSAGMVPAEGRHVSPNGLLPINGTEMLTQTLSSVNGGLSPNTVAPTNGASVSDAVSDAPTGTWFQTLSGQEEEQIRGYQCGNTPAQDHEMTYYSGISHAGESPVFLNAAGRIMGIHYLKLFWKNKALFFLCAAGIIFPHRLECTHRREIRFHGECLCGFFRLGRIMWC